MPGRSPGNYNHVVAQRGLSRNVDGDNVFRFGVLEACEDQFKSTGSGIDATFQSLREDAMRLPLGVYCCQGCSFLPRTEQALAPNPL
jgi:hypothetical protein